MRMWMRRRRQSQQVGKEEENWSVCDNESMNEYRTSVCVCVCVSMGIQRCAVLRKEKVEEVQPRAFVFAFAIFAVCSSASLVYVRKVMRNAGVCVRAGRLLV